MYEYIPSIYPLEFKKIVNAFDDNRVEYISPEFSKVFKNKKDIIDRLNKSSFAN